MKAQEVVRILEPKLENLLEKMGLELVDIEFRREGKRLIFRTYIDREEGVDLDTCEEASRMIEAVLDEENLIDEPYYLEVSSPGLDRLLKKDRDFVRFQGRKVKVKTMEPIEGQKNFTGILKGLVEEKILVEVGNKTVNIPKDKALSVRLVVEL